MSSKIINIDFENKRKIPNGDFFVSYGDTFPIILSNGIVTTNDGSSTTLASNFTENSQILAIGETIGYYSKIDDCQLFQTNLNSIEECQSTNQSRIDERQGPASFDPDDRLTTLKFEFGEVKIGSQLSEAEKTQLIKLLTTYKDTMGFSGRLGRTHLIEYQIEIDRSQPVHVPPYRVSPQQREDIIKQTKQMLDQDIIEPSRSAWSSPIVLLKKPESKGIGSRFCTDFRQINQLTKNWAYQLPLINDYLRSLSGYKLFTTLDAAQGFYQVPIREEDKEITAFIVPGYGSFQFSHAHGIKMFSDDISSIDG